MTISPSALLFSALLTSALFFLTPDSRLLTPFPVAQHDDGPDALEMALRLATELFAGRQHNDGLGNRLPVGQD